MKNGNLVLALIVLSTTGLWSQERMVLRERGALNIGKLMEDHQIYVARIQDLDFDDEGNIYVLDDRSGNVVRINLKTGSLLNRISSMGQGPAELMRPGALRIRNNKVFILSGAFIKIFSQQGELLRGFRPESNPRGLDVDGDGNIYVAGLDREGHPIISVYDMAGNYAKTALTLPLSKETLKNEEEAYKNLFFLFRLDKEGNILILHNLLRKLTKYGPGGTVIWERKIENPLLEPFYKNEGTVFDSQGQPTIMGIIAKFDIDENSNIFIAHQGGGCIYNPNGELIYVVEVRLEESKRGPLPIRVPRLYRDKLVTVFINSDAIMFPYELKNPL